MRTRPSSVALSILNGCSKLFRLLLRFTIRMCLAILPLLFLGAADAQGQPQTLSHHVRSEVISGKAALVGPLPADQQLNLSLVLPLRNKVQLTALLGRLYDPSSPDYRKFLSVEQFADQFGATAADYQAAISFAQANGLTITGNHANRLVVPVSGTTAQINHAFNVRMGVYQHPTENRTFFSPDREPSLALSVPIAHIAGLNNFSKPKPLLVSGQNTVPITNAIGSGPGASYLGSDMRAAYYGGTTLTGIGQAVGILEFEGYYLSDVNATFSNAGQSYSVPINNVLLDGVTGNPTVDDGEAVLDIVQAIGMAPGLSQVRVYIGRQDANVLSKMASENIAKQLTCSWSWSPDDPSVADIFFQEFAAQGQTFFAASGDYGAYDAAIDPYSYPQEDVYVTAVGGTHLTTTGASGAWVSETAWNSTEPGTNVVFGSGGGISPDGIGLPSWQSGIANASNGGSATLRNVPDVAMEADFDNYMCSMGSCANNGAGTSFAAPRWAGFMALVNQQAMEAGNAPKGGLGFINPAIYAIGLGSSYGSDFHDISQGNNDTENQPTWFSAVPGYDLVTGWGSANGQMLIDALAGPQVPGFWISASSPNISVNPGSSGSATISITDAGGFSGDVTLAITSQLPTGVTALWGTNPTTGNSLLTLTASSNAPSSSTLLTITGTSGTLTQTVTITAVVHPPDFTLYALPNSLNVAPGSSTTSTVTVFPLFGFSGNVNLSVSGLPTGVTASWGTNPTSGKSVLTLNASSTAAGGTTALTITGTSGSITETAALTLTVNAPSFSLSGGGTVSMGQAATGNAYIYVTDLYGFTGNVNFSVSGLPAGVTASFNPNSTTSFSVLTLTGNGSAAIGTSQLTITGTSGSLSATTTITLNVMAPTFTLSGYGGVNVGQGHSTTSYIYVNPAYGFAGGVNLSVSGLPAGVTASFSPNPTTGSSTLTVTASSSANVGNSTLTVTGTSGSVTATTTVTLGVFAPTFTISGGSLQVGQGSSSSTWVSVSPQYGFAGSVTLAVSGLPSGVTALWNPNPTTGSSQLTLVAASTVTPGQYPLTITGTSSSLSATTTLSLGVYVPTFTLYGGGNVNVGQGTSNTTYVNVSAQYGFKGSVNLALSGLPSGVTGVFTPNPTTNSSTLVLTASSSAALGQYNLTITGTSGSQSATTTLTLGVYVPTFTLYGGSASIGQGTTTTTYVSVSQQYGFTGSVNLAVFGLPSGVTASFSPNPTTSTSTLTLTASSTAALGQYNLTITGTSGTQTATTTVSLGVYVPTFTLQDQGSLNIGQGTSGTAWVDIFTQYGFGNGVILSVSGLPSGVTASFAPNPSTGYQSILTLTASSTAALGQYTLTITGTSGSQTASITLTLGVYTPSFTIGGGGTLSVGQGSSGMSYLYITPQYGFSGSVSLTASGLPSGVSAFFSPNPATGTSSILNLTASSSAPTGQYTVSITGTSGSQTASTTLTLVISAQSFTLYAPNSINMNEGSTATAYVSIYQQYGFIGSVTLAVSGLPSGVTASFSPNPATLNSVLTLTTSSSATPGNANVAITGTSGGLTASTGVALTVNSPGFTLSDAPGQVNLVPGGSETSTILVVPTVNGFNGSVNLSITGLPSGVTASFSPNPASLSSTLTLTASNDANIGTANAIVIGTSGSATANAPLVVTVHNASAATSTSLTVTSSGNDVTTVAAGTQVTLTATVNAASTVLTQGQVSFCDATAASCTGSHLLGSAQLTSAGTASLKFIPGMGSNSYKAVFAGTNSNTPSSSGASRLTVTSKVATTTRIAQVGTPGNFTLTATVTGAGLLAPTGSVAFLDATNGNSKLASAELANAQSALTWLTPQVSPNVALPYALASADFNGDGVLDLAVTNQSVQSVVILLGKGDGTFTPAATSLSVGGVPGVVTVGDFNMDGKVDLAVSNISAGSMLIFLGNGDGTFTASTSTPAISGTPVSIAVGDFNHDGKPDLAVATSAFGVMVLLGNGDGTFTPSGWSAQTSGSPEVLVAADFNGDGILDLAVTDSGSTPVSVFLGNGDGTFTPFGSFATVHSPYGLAAGDFNGDGKVDLAVGSTTDNVVEIFLGNGDGTFTAISANSKTGSLPQGIAVADFDGNGKLDIAVANATSNTVTFLLGNGDGTFTSGGASSAGAGPTQFAVGDLNGDGLADLAVVNILGNSVTVLSPQLTQTVTATASSISTLSSGTHNVEASFPGDSNYKSSLSSTVQLTGQPGTPAMLVTPSPSSITTLQALSVTVSVGAANSNPTPAGSVTLASGSFSQQQTLSVGSTTFSIPAGTLPIGSDTLTATYSPDASSAVTYTSASQSATVAVSASISAKPVSPSISVNPSLSSITTLQALSVAIAVSGGNPTPTGSVTLVSGSFSRQQTLSAGSTVFSIPAGTLPVGRDTLTATYTPDAFGAVTYTSATQSVTVAVTASIGAAISTVTITPSSANITDTESDTVAVSVAGTSGQALPTGTIVFSSGSYSAQQTLSGGQTSFAIAPGTLSSGINTFTATYSGDNTYATANATASITVSEVVIALSTPSPVLPGSIATATATFLAGSNYSGTMNLTCTLNASPSGAQSLPTCTLNPVSITLQAAGSATTTLSVNTTAASNASLVMPKRLQLWGLGFGGSALGFVVVFGASSRRRRWLPMLVLICIIAAAGVIGCGGGSGGGSSQQGQGTAATTAGNYTFTVTGTDSSNPKITASKNVTIVLQ